MDERDRLRNPPLLAVLQQLGVTSEWKSRKGGTEWAGPCPVCRPKNNEETSASTSTADSDASAARQKAQAIDLAMQVTQVGFQQAVEFLTVAWLKTVPSRLPQPSREPSTQASAETPPFTGTYEKFFKPHPGCPCVRPASRFKASRPAMWQS
jgi:hypothetical protein